jgi:hypothetical protein
MLIVNNLPLLLSVELHVSLTGDSILPVGYQFSICRCLGRGMTANSRVIIRQSELIREICLFANLSSEVY